jgi:hypothetical protein
MLHPGVTAQRIGAIATRDPMEEFVSFNTRSFGQCGSTTFKSDPEAADNRISGVSLKDSKPWPI